MLDLTVETNQPGRLAFQRLAAAHALSAAGDTLVAIALADTLFFRISASDARLNLALYLLLTMTPFALLAPLVGPWIDRLRGGRRLAMMVAALARGGLALAMAAAGDNIALYPAAFGVLVMSRAHGVTRSALIPTIATTGSSLVSANARLARVAVMAGAVAAAPGIVLVKAVSRAGPLYLAVAAFALTAVAAAALPRPSTPVNQRLEADHARLTPHIEAALAVNAIIRGLGGFLLFLLAFALKRRDVSDAGFGFALAVSGAGSFVGATFVPRLRRAGNEDWILVMALMTGGVAALVASRSFGLDLAALLGGAVGVVTASGRLAFDSIVQREAHEAAHGRTFARFETRFQTAWVIGAAIPVILPQPWASSERAIGFWLTVCAVLFFGVAAWYLAILGKRGRSRLAP